MKHKIAIYAENPTAIDAVLGQIKYQNIDFLLNDIYEMPGTFDVKATFLIVETKEVLDRLHIEQAELLIVIIPSTLYVKSENKLSDATVYRRRSDESNQIVIDNILLSLVLPYMDKVVLDLDHIDIIRSTSFNRTGYLAISRMTISELLKPHNQQIFSLEKTRRIQQSPAIIVSMFGGEKNFTLKKIEKVADTISNQLDDDYPGDFFYQGNLVQPNLTEGACVLYTLLDK